MAGLITLFLVNTGIAQVSQERETGTFKAIENRSSVDLYIYQGTTPRVVIEEQRLTGLRDSLALGPCSVTVFALDAVP